MESLSVSYSIDVTLSAICFNFSSRLDLTLALTPSYLKRVYIYMNYAGLMKGGSFFRKGEGGGGEWSSLNFQYLFKTEKNSFQFITSSR